MNRFATAVALAALCAAAAHAAPPTVSFAGCTEFVGVAPVDATAARALVPAAYTLVSDAAGAKLVVRVADCAAVQVGSQPARPGRVGQVGLIIVSPDGTATDPLTSINNYTLLYAADSRALVQALRSAGIPAALDDGLAYEAAAGELFAAIAPPEGTRWTLWGTVNAPALPQPFLANWWYAGPRGEAKMATTIPSIAFDFGSQVSFYASRAGVLGSLLPSSRIAGFPLSFRGAFDAGTMVVSVKR